MVNLILGNSLQLSRDNNKTRTRECEIDMPLITELRNKFMMDRFEYSKHATDQSVKRDISVDEVKDAILDGGIIEDYPEDKYGPSCLVFGRTSAGRPLHVQCTYPIRPLVKIITLYEPDPDQWIMFRSRK